MLTIFSTCKPFRGHFAIIQRNAITSWTLLRPRPEIILFGDEEGVAEICAELGLRHVPEIARNEFGTPLLSDIFQKAHATATNDILCYVNADIILMSDFMTAIQRVSSWREQFLIVGRRWDLDVTGPIDFTNSEWEKLVRARALKANAPRPPSWIDYFVFTKNLYHDIPPFAVGRLVWDNWMIWRALALGVPVVDISPAVVVVHQNHDYSHHPKGETGVQQGQEAQRNYCLAGGWTRLCTIDDATHCFDGSVVRLNLTIARLRRKKEMFLRWLIDVTRPVRHKLGIRRLQSSQG
jgi:hypothetical protein